MPLAPSDVGAERGGPSSLDTNPTISVLLEKRDNLKSQLADLLRPHIQEEWISKGRDPHKMPAPHDVLSRLIDAYGNPTAAQGNGQNLTITELRS